MSLPLENHQPVGLVDDRLLVRLVDGEVPDDERRALLLRLEAEPEGWRRCALAFLEAQSWREALNPLAGAAVSSRLVRPDRRVRKPRPWQRLALLAGLAASVAAAFALGWALYLQPMQPLQDGVVANGTESAPAATAERREPAPADLTTATPQPNKPGATFVRVDPFVKKMEQRGFRAQTQQRLLSMHLKDGRKLDLPVQEVRLQYVRNRTY